MTPDSGVLSAVPWPSSHHTRPPSLPNTLLRAPVHHSQHWTRSLLSLLVLLFLLLPHSKTEKQRKSSRRDRGGRGGTGGGRRRGIRSIFSLLLSFLVASSNIYWAMQGPNKEANFTLLHLHNWLAVSFYKDDQSHLSKIEMDVSIVHKRKSYSLPIGLRRKENVNGMYRRMSEYHSIWE